MIKNKSNKLKILFSLMVSINLFTYPVVAEEIIKKEQIDIILKNHQNKSPENFKDFLKEVNNEIKDVNLRESIDLFNRNQIVKDNDWLNIYRLLGIYSKLTYKNQMIETLSQLVEIPTDKKDDLPQYKNPQIIKFGQTIEKIAKDFGLEYRNIDNRIFEVVLKGKSKEEFGVYTHADVVPVDYSRWILPDNTKLNPFKLTKIDNKLYGRGTEDDKCSIVTSLYAMKTIKDNNLPLNRSIKLLIETTEETSGEGIEYYKIKNKVPDYNIVLDSTYPLVIAEKGSGVISAKYDIKPAEGVGAEIIDMTGGLAYNHIPSISIVTIKSGDSVKLNSLIIEKAEEYIKNNGNDFKIESIVEPDLIKLSIIGKSAHSAGPQNGINPVARACDFISKLSKEINFKNNAFKYAALFIADNFGLDYYGNKLNINYKDDFMGPLTAVPTLIKTKNNVIEIAVNLRSPRGKEPEDFKKEIVDKLTNYQIKNNNPFKLDVRIGKYMYRDIKGKWINTLLSTFSDVTGKEAKPLSISGTTTAKQLPNGVCFGPAMPGETYTGHTDNEFKKIENFLFDLQIFTEMFMRIGNLKDME